ncbi:MAG: MoaD/ThiS family protein [Gemmatimonadales bacterium]|nr:MoaD/ThiS family protein [Gemmatimonadales bacterium]
MTGPKAQHAPIRVLLFARYAELLGTNVLEVHLSPGATVGDVLDRVREFPGGDAIGGSTLVALNHRQVGRGAPVGSGDEVAILPPLAGG